MWSKIKLIQKKKKRINILPRSVTARHADITAAEPSILRIYAFRCLDGYWCARLVPEAAHSFIVPSTIDK